MIKLLNLLLEMSFGIDNRFEYKKETPTKYTFTTGANQYEVVFTVYYKTSKTYERSYRPKGIGFTGKTNEGVPLKVLATVTAITLDFLDTNKNWETVLIRPVSKSRFDLVKKYMYQPIFTDKYIIEDSTEEGFEIRITRKNN